MKLNCTEQRWSRGHKARGQGQEHKKNPRPRTDPLEAGDRNARGQSQGLRTQAQVFSKKKSSKKILGDLQKKRSSKNFLGVRRNKTSKNFFR